MGLFLDILIIMSLLLTCWLLSLVLLLGIVFYTHTSKSVRALSSEGAIDNLGDFAVALFREMSGEFLRGAALLRPHGEHIVLKSGILIKRGHNMLIEKAFGRMRVEKGKAPSFFLKHIAEHKEALGEKDRGEE